MATRDFKRKLSAILSADVAGYSRLMGEDEAATVEAITTYREIMGGLIRQHRGLVVDSPGDNILAEFPSVVDAVQCAVAIQKEFQARNAELPENRRMEFRIGINLGDVIEEEGRIYGDGVNIAARLEALADPGGICVSKTAFDHIETKLPLGYEYLGDQTVKNIARPVGAYRVLMEPRVTVAGEVEKEKVVPVGRRKAILAGGVALILVVIAGLIWHFYFRHPSMEPASVEKMAFPLPDKPSIAVLPFNNLSGDPTQEYIADGISENIISALSKISEMFVIARNSTFTYKSKPVKIQQVSEELGVRYILEGSTQKIGNRVRITAQLIDATTGHHLWSEKYDREFRDLFDLQDEITHKIIVELQVKLTEGEQARVSHKSTTNLEAWSYAVRGLKLFERPSKENNAKAMEFLERAVELDPGYVWAWVRLAWTHLVASRAPGWSHSPSESFKKAVEISQRVLALDESDSDVRALLGNVCLRQKRYEQAITEGEKSLALGPTNAQAHVILAASMNEVGRFDDAIELVKRAVRLHPYYPAYYLIWLGGAYRMTGRYEDALTAYRQLLDRSRKGEYPIIGAHLFLAEVYIELGREEEAQTHAAEVLRIAPKFSLGVASKIATYTYKDPAHLERRLNTLRKAGLPENPPLPFPDKPSIAVLPFANISGDPKEDYLSDGITEQIITALSKIPRLFVIARNSTFTYKGKPVNVQQVSRELGVRYVLEGSVQKSGNRLRITAQLIDAKTGAHLWAEKFDRELNDIFALQDEITLNVLSALQVHLGEAEDARLWAKGTDNIEAYIKFLQGLGFVRQWDKESLLVKAPKMFEEAIALDPQYATPYFFLAFTTLNSVFFDTSIDPEQSYYDARNLLHRGLEINESDAYGKCVQSQFFLVGRNYEKAIESAEDAIKLEPNMAEAHAHLGANLHWAGRYEEAIPQLKKAIRLNPIPPDLYLYWLGSAYQLLGMLEKSVSAYNKAILQNRDFVGAHMRLAVSYVLMDRLEEARSEVAEVLRIDPKFSAERVINIYPYKNSAAKDLMIEALDKAGLK